jgi:hypothetical protein
MKVHVRFRGESHTLDADQYGIEGNMSDRSIKSLLTEVYELPRDALETLVVDRNPDSIVVRPQAVFG